MAQNLRCSHGCQRFCVWSLFSDILVDILQCAGALCIRVRHFRIWLNGWELCTCGTTYNAKSKFLWPWQFAQILNQNTNLRLKSHAGPFSPPHPLRTGTSSYYSATRKKKHVPRPNFSYSFFPNNKSTKLNNMVVSHPTLYVWCRVLFIANFLIWYFLTGAPIAICYKRLFIMKMIAPDSVFHLDSIFLIQIRTICIKCYIIVSCIRRQPWNFILMACQMQSWMPLNEGHRGQNTELFAFPNRFPVQK